MVKFRAMIVAAALVAVSLTGCGTDIDCIPVSAVVPASAKPGETIDVEMTDVYPGCNAPDNWLRADKVHLQLVSVDTREAVLATGSSTVASDGTATVQLTIPDDASGIVSVESDDGFSLGTVTVTD